MLPCVVEMPLVLPTKLSPAKLKETPRREPRDTEVLGADRDQEPCRWLERCDADSLWPAGCSTTSPRARDGLLSTWVTWMLGSRLLRASLSPLAIAIFDSNKSRPRRLPFGEGAIEPRCPVRDEAAGAIVDAISGAILKTSDCNSRAPLGLEVCSAPCARAWAAHRGPASRDVWCARWCWKLWCARRVAKPLLNHPRCLGSLCASLCEVVLRRRHL
mmetsp:Transcript_116203/g.369795  ORF Transcript_116203/g.369795 Transcript_116203/m.369795 type:complete len:216 (-) Transcript_116203:652-1299(-)